MAKSRQHEVSEDEAITTLQAELIKGRDGHPPQRWLTLGKDSETLAMLIARSIGDHRDVSEDLAERALKALEDNGVIEIADVNKMRCYRLRHGPGRPRTVPADHKRIMVRMTTEEHEEVQNYLKAVRGQAIVSDIIDRGLNTYRDVYRLGAWITSEHMSSKLRDDVAKAGHALAYKLLVQKPGDKEWKAIVVKLKALFEKK